MSRRRVAMSWEEHGQRVGLEDGRRRGKSAKGSRRGGNLYGPREAGPGRRRCVRCAEICGIKGFAAGDDVCMDCRDDERGVSRKRRCACCGERYLLEKFEGAETVCRECVRGSRGRRFEAVPLAERRRVAEAIVDARGYSFVDEAAREAMVVAMMWDGGK